MLRTIASRLPASWQNELKRLYFKRQIRKGHFITEEPEYKILDKYIGVGDWVIDVGANVGHYTKRFSELVGASGRVIAFEPEPTSFSLLAANMQLLESKNVSLINAAVSDNTDIVGMNIPRFSSGPSNYYRANISDSSSPEIFVLTLPVDHLSIDHNVSLVKIDAEGHEKFVVEGMWRLIEACRPVLVIETDSEDIKEKLHSIGYTWTRLEGSPNILFTPSAV